MSSNRVSDPRAGISLLTATIATAIIGGFVIAFVQFISRTTQSQLRLRERLTKTQEISARLRSLMDLPWGHADLTLGSHIGATGENYDWILENTSSSNLIQIRVVYKSSPPIQDEPTVIGYKFQDF